MLAALARQFGPCYVLPEGGSNGLAVLGTAELADEITTEFDVVCCGTGTGGTLAGIASGLSGPERALGFAVIIAVVSQALRLATAMSLLRSSRRHEPVE